MRIHLSIVVLTAVATVACASRPVDPNDTVTRTEMQLVLAAEDAYVAAEVNRDESALRRLVDERFVFNAANGSTSGKEELIRASSVYGCICEARRIVADAGSSNATALSTMISASPREGTADGEPGRRHGTFNIVLQRVACADTWRLPGSSGYLVEAAFRMREHRPRSNPRQPFHRRSLR
jgi:hypothetical protein